MLTIINKDLNDTKVVTKGAYKELYESLGYGIVTNKPLKKEVEKKEIVEKEEEKLNEKGPLSIGRNKGESERYSRK